MPIFSFLNPSFLWALPVTAIPIIIHLLSRRRLPEVNFPTTQFLRALEPQEIRRLRLRELLLLLLRTLALAFLVLAFARPSLAPRGAVTHAAAAVGILIDDSASMGAVDERGRPRMESAIARAVALAEAARAGDELYLARTTRPDDPEAGRSRDRVRLQRAIERLEPAPLPSRTAEALRALRLALGRSALLEREIYVISDLQRAGLPPEARAELAQAARAKMRVHVLPVAQGRTPNHGFEAVDPETRPGPDGRGLEIRARLANHADAPSDRLAIRVRRGDALIGGGDVTLRAGETKWVPMPLEWGAAGDSGALPVVAESDEDAFSLDDRWYAVLGAPRRLRVLRVAEARAGAPPPRFAALALDPSQNGASGFAVETATPASLLSLSRARRDAVLLEDVASLSADAETKIRAFIKEGGGLVVALGPHSDPDYYTRRLFPGLIDLVLEQVERAPEGSAFELRARIPGHPVLEGLSVGVGSPLTQARLTGLVRGRAAGRRADVVVQTTGGFPLVVASPSVAVFLSSLGDDWGDLPYSGAFVPLIRGMVAHAARAGPAAAGGEPRVGERPEARFDAAPLGALLVRGPGGYASPAAVEVGGATYRAVADGVAPAPGFYVFESGGRPVATAAVNLDPAESELAALPADSLRAPAGPNAAAVLVIPTRAALETLLRDTRRGRELWTAFLIGAAALLIAELALGSARVLRP
jgi:hypothetical protein